MKDSLSPACLPKRFHPNGFHDTVTRRNRVSVIRVFPNEETVQLIQNLEASRTSGAGLFRAAVESSGRNVLAILLLLMRTGGASGGPRGRPP